jgi:hypothetical protein
MLSGKPLTEQIPTNTITPNRTNFPKDTTGPIRERYEKQSSETGLQTEVFKAILHEMYRQTATAIQYFVTNTRET